MKPQVGILRSVSDDLHGLGVAEGIQRQCPLVAAELAGEGVGVLNFWQARHPYLSGVIVVGEKIESQPRVVPRVAV